MQSNNEILIVGPRSIDSKLAYGGGTGGYTRNLSVYLSTLEGGSLRLRAFRHSVRGEFRGARNLRAARLVLDSTAFFVTCIFKRPSAVHILAQYRGAIFREVVQVLICRLLRIPVGYDVKAGAFVSGWEQGGRVYRAAVRYVINASQLLFVEGKKTQDLLAQEFGRAPLYFPNFVPSKEVPADVPERCAADVIKLLFVGFCCREKGVLELVQGAMLAARTGIKVELNLIGAESQDVDKWLTTLSAHQNMTIIRHGKQPHAKVLAAMQRSDIYVYPTSHAGEGHNNSINEAMMYGLVILTTRQGFLGDILSDNTAFFLDSVDANNVAAGIKAIVEDRSRARKVGIAARNKLLSDYTDDAARSKFVGAYEKLICARAE